MGKKQGYSLISDLAEKTIVKQYDKTALTGLPKKVRQWIQIIYGEIPDKKRISTGIYSTIKALGCLLEEIMKQKNQDCYAIAVYLLSHQRPEDHDGRIGGTGLQLLSLWACDKQNDFNRIFPYFEQSAGSDHWVLREHCVGFFRKVIKAYPGPVKDYLKKLARSQDDKLRRFAVETMRPVVENQWFYRELDYYLDFLQLMFKEPAAYPRTSTGNSLSDLARHHPELVYKLVNQLVSTGDSNANWIATRACRNLVKTDPKRVMDTLGVDEYRYKNRYYSKMDEGN